MSTWNRKESHENKISEISSLISRDPSGDILSGRTCFITHPEPFPGGGCNDTRACMFSNSQNHRNGALHFNPTNLLFAV